MLSTLVGSRLPARYHRLFKLPERSSSSVIADTAGTTLGRMSARWLKANECENGVCRLSIGVNALGVRLELIELAESSVDIQSYLVRDDLSGNLIATALIRAAERGVRVRLLMDDALTQPVDPGLLALGNHRNIEVRVFNPFPRNRSRFLSFIANFNLLNRRMHNKSFTVDNQFTIVGGRNLADEYFQSSAQSEFLDEDLLATGAVVGDVSRGFDEYWNTIEATPIEFLGTPHALLTATELLAEGERFIAAHPSARRIEQQGRFGLRLLEDGLTLVPAAAEVVLDHPDKVRGLVRRRLGETTEYLRKMASSAVSELIIVSPYFVPLRAGVDLFAALVRKGVRVVIVTNSLASTNHSSVHAVYARYRKPLLRQGIELYELRPRPGLASELGTDALHITLHSKVAVADRRSLFVGSFNLDPRSLYINTEMGMAVSSRGLAAEMAESIERLLPELTYRLELTARNRLNWAYVDDGVNETAQKEPHTTVWRRLSTRLMSLLPIESQM